MKTNLYLNKLNQVLEKLEITNFNNESLTLEDSVEICIQELKKYQNRQIGKVIVIGNGGSAAIASHTTVDYMKNGKIPTLSFNEGSILTCYGNDYGYENVFLEPLKQVLAPQDLLIAISSSGSSNNIVFATEYAINHGAFVLTLSGFKPSNPLRKLGNVNVYTPNTSYGIVELTHQIYLHMLLDILMES